MINQKIDQILKSISDLNPVFNRNYYFVDPNRESENTGIDDSKGNHFFATFADVPNGANVTFTETPYSGCGGYIQTATLNIYFVLDACYMPEKAFAILSQQLGALYDVTINAGGYNARSIYQSLTGQELPRQMTIVYFQVTIRSEVLLGENCETSICEETCC